MDGPSLGERLGASNDPALGIELTLGDVLEKTLGLELGVTEGKLPG